ncbi:hypothetical protein KKG46_00125 [Patescibacteria group bacterium]|nr:hypothetical protein [Patescibacteria group bacterium]
MSSTQVRVSGYVVGYKVCGGELLWTVKVKDPKSVHDGKKFTVQSCQVGTMLSRPSVDVSFRVAPIQVGEEFSLKAVEVALVGKETTESTIKRIPDDSEVIYLVVLRYDHGTYASFVGYDNEVEAREAFEADGEKMIAFLRIPVDEEGLDVEVRASLNAIAALTYVEGTRDAIEHILTKLISALEKQGFGG